MSEPFIGEIQLFGGNFPPRGWAYCNGALLPIQNYQALFSILGTTYGGDGRTTFGLPDLLGRVPLHPGTGAGLPTIRLGEKGGYETLRIDVTEGSDIEHTHSVPGATPRGEASQTSATFSEWPAGVRTLQPTNMQPYLALNVIIALVGTFPSRN